MANEVNASHILVKTEKEALAILNDLKNGKSFEEIAGKVSLCPSGKNGVELGWFGRGQMVPEFENACFSAKPGPSSARRGPANSDSLGQSRHSLDFT